MGEKYVNGNTVYCEVYSIQHYVIKYVGDFRQVGTPVSNKTDCHDITEILLKVALNTIKPNQTNLLFE